MIFRYLAMFFGVLELFYTPLSAHDHKKKVRQIDKNEFKMF